MNLYTILADAKDNLRRAKDHEQTIRAITEFVELSGKNADDRKRELAYVLSQDKAWRHAQAGLRDAELAVDNAQAAIDQAETERRDREWKIRQRLSEVLNQQHIASDDIDPFETATLNQLTNRLERIARSRDQYAGVAREMLDAYNSGIADRINGAGEFEEDDEPETLYRQRAAREMDELFST